MTVQDYYNLKNKDTITDTDLSPLEDFITDDFPNINFYNSHTDEGVSKNTEVIINDLYVKSDGYRGIWVYSISFQGEQIALYLKGGRDGRDSKKYCVTNKNKYIEAMTYLENLLKDDTHDINIIDANEELEELNMFYSTDMTQAILDIDLRFNVKVGDTILVDIEYNNEDGNPIVFKQVRGQITKLKGDTLVDPVSIRLLDYKLGSEYFLGKTRETYYYMLPKYDVFREPLDWKAFNDSQKEHLKDIFKGTRRNFQLNFALNYNKIQNLGILVA